MGQPILLDPELVFKGPLIIKSSDAAIIGKTKTVSPLLSNYV